MLNGLQIIESPYVSVGGGFIFLAEHKVFLHPLDAVMLQHPDFTPAQRVDVLVTRIVDRVLARLDHDGAADRAVIAAAEALG